MKASISSAKMAGILAGKMVHIGSNSAPTEFTDYITRVEADSGIIRSKPNTLTMIKLLKNLGLLSKTKVLVDTQMGAKKRAVSPYNYITKVYSPDALSVDSVQATTGSQPLESLFEGQLVNPNMKTNFMTHTPISFSDSEAWSMTLGVNHNGAESDVSQYVVANRIGLNAGLLLGTNQSISWRESVKLVTLPFLSTVKLSTGLFNVIHLVFDGNTTIKLFINGIEKSSITSKDSVYFSRIINGSSTNGAFAGKLFYYRIQSDIMSNDEISSESENLLSIETVALSTINNNIFQKNNLDIARTASNVKIPDGTLTSTWITGASALCYHTGSIGLMGKLYNKAAKLVITANPPVGYHVSTEAELTAILPQGGTALKTALGLSILHSSRNADGSFNTWNTGATIYASDADKVLFLDTTNAVSIVAVTANEGHAIRLVKDGFTQFGSFNYLSNFNLVTGAVASGTGVIVTGTGTWVKNMMHPVDTYLENVRMDVSFRIITATSFSFGIGKYNTQFGNSEVRITATNMELWIINESGVNVMEYQSAHGLNIRVGNVLKLSFLKTTDDCTYVVTDGFTAFSKQVLKIGTSGITDAYNLAKMWGNPYIACTSGSAYIDTITLSSDYSQSVSKLGIWGNSLVEGATMVSSGLQNRFSALIAANLGVNICPSFGKGGQSMSTTWFNNFKVENKWFNPAYVMVDLGANNTDYTSYLSALQSTIAEIKANGQTAILMTITPRPGSEYVTVRVSGNAWIRSSGELYVDVANAVTVQGDESTWQSGLVQADLIHPNTAGHLAIYNRCLTDVPELFI